MEPATFLSLNDDCLCNIVSFISDCSTFNSLARTCKRLRQVTNSSRNCHINILRSKAQFYLKQMTVNLAVRYNKSRGDAYDEYQKFQGLLKDAVRYSRTKNFLSYEKVVDVWEKSGPVACELFTWIRNYSKSVSEGEPRATCRTEDKSFTIHLPKCDQDMTIDTSYFHDYIGNYDDELSVKVKCGDLKIEKEDLSRMMPEDYKYWSEEEVNKVYEPMKPVSELLQKEVGETVPSIHANFLIWFLFLFPMDSRIYEEDRLVFKNASKNEKPSLQSIQPMLEFYQKSLSGSFQKSSAKWIQNDSESCKNIVESLDVLVQKSDTGFLDKAEGAISRFYNLTTSYDLRNMPEKQMFSLIVRTTIETDNFSSGATADKYVDNKVSFRLLGNKVMQVNGGMQGDGASYPTWERVVVDFHLPDNKNINMDSGYIYGPRKAKQPLDIGELSPVTRLLQECINHDLQGEEQIPEITDIFTAVYFLHALDFGGETEPFIGKPVNEANLIVQEDSDEASDESNSD